MDANACSRAHYCSRPVTILVRLSQCRYNSASDFLKVIVEENLKEIVLKS